MDLKMDDLSAHVDSTADRVILNVGGKVFCTSLESLNRLPETKLGKLSKCGAFNSSNELFFDRNPKVMHGILDLYRTGELHLPNNLCSTLIRKELEFWEVPEELISECCWKTYQSSKSSKCIIDHIDLSLSDPYGLAHLDTHHGFSFSTRLWLALEHPNHSLTAKIWNFTYVVFMMVSIIIFALETVDSLRGPGRPSSNTTSLTPQQLLLFSQPLELLHYLDVTCNVFFTLEPLVRLVTCPNRRIFLLSPLNIVDLFLVITMWVGLALEDFIVPGISEASQGHVYLILTMRAVLALRVLRVLHLTKRFDSMKVMVLSMKASVQELGLLMAVLFMAVLIYGNFAYLAEFIAGTHMFHNVPMAVWWAIITMTTVGYGDYYPTSVVGYFIGSACAITGLLILAMPIAIIATNFSTYYENLASCNQRRARKAFIRNVLGRLGPLVRPTDAAHSLVNHCKDLTCCVTAAPATPDVDLGPFCHTCGAVGNTCECFFENRRGESTVASSSMKTAHSSRPSADCSLPNTEGQREISILSNGLLNRLHHS